MAMGSATAPVAPHAPAHEHSLEHCGLCLLAAHAFTFVQDQPAPAGLVECMRPVLRPDGTGRSAAALRLVTGEFPGTSATGLRA